MALKVFNYTNDNYIEGEDTRGQLKGILGNDGYGFRGSVVRSGTTNVYTVKAGSVAFIGGLCALVKTDEAFDLTSNRYIVIETSYVASTDKYTCILKAANTIDTTKQGDVTKHFAVYDKISGTMSSLESGGAIKGVKGNGTIIAPDSGGTVNITAASIGAQPKITFGTASPSGGSHGDIYIKYS